MPIRPAKDYKAYTDGYFKIVEHFKDKSSRPLTIDGLTRKEAQSRRHALYRFFHALRDAYNIDGYAAELSSIADTLVIAINGTADELYALHIYRDPIANLSFFSKDEATP